MAKHKHTPGPWIYQEATPQSHSAWYEVLPSKGNESIVFVEHKADARLIACAPELLAMLEDCVNWFETNGIDGVFKDENDMIQLIAAVIKKAKGEQ